LEANVKRLLLFCAITTSTLLCLDPPVALLRESTKSVARGRLPALVLTSLEGSKNTIAGEVATQGSGNKFDVDLTFKGPNGSAPAGALIQDAAGNLYGTTTSGGNGFGTIFKLDSSRHETVLHVFKGPDGATPYGALVLDSLGNIYATTSGGGNAGLGTVFKIDPQGNEIVLHSFNGTPDGANPYAGLVVDSSGNLYGTTANGGAFGSGTVFEIAPSGVETVLHSFAGGPTDGAGPMARLTLDGNGNLYGTTFAGGTGGYGTVFRLDPTNLETVIYNFTGGPDGGNPLGGVTLDATGVLYGTTELSSSTVRPYGCCKGTVFVLNGSNETVLYTFTGGNDGGTPACDLVLYNGVLYGTTMSGGPSQGGTVFALDVVTGSETVLHGFTGQGDGGTPRAGLLLSAPGILYGTAQRGGQFMKGVVYQENP
jgi:uncharacterized repeat protein (TIGR03803 family)